MRLLTPKEVTEIEFDTRDFQKREWYDASQVDDVLDDCAYTIKYLAENCLKLLKGGR